MLVVDKYDAVPDEDFVLDRHAFANKGVTGNLAVSSYEDAFLDFHERADFGVIANLTTVEIDEVIDDYALTELDVRRDDTELSGHGIGNWCRVFFSSRLPDQARKRHALRDTARRMIFPQRGID